MLEIVEMRRFRKDIKRLQKQGKVLEKLKQIINLLVEEKTMDSSHRDHSLIGDYNDFRECHIMADWLLIYQIQDGVLKLARTGSHSELFN